MRVANRNAIASLLIVVTYVISGKAALMLALPPGYASAIFPPAGIAVAAAFILGRRSLQWVFLGSLLLNLWVSYSASHQITTTGFAAAVIIAVASTLQAAVGGWILRRSIGYPTAFDRARDLFRFLLLAPVICLVSASLSVYGLWAINIFDTDSLGGNWLSWWIGDSLGVMTMLPIAMVFAGEPRALWRGRLKTVALPMVLIFMLFVAMFLKTNQWEQDESLTDFRQISRLSLNQIKAKLDEQESVLAEMRGLFTHAPDMNITRQEFQRYTRDMLARFPMIQAFEWAPRIDSPRRAGFETAQRKDVPGFEIRERDAKGVLRPAQQRKQYYPVTYVEPVPGNTQALGFDLASTPQRQEALTRSAANGAITASAPIRLIQANNQTGMLIMQSVQINGKETGVVVAVLKMQEFMDKVLPPASAVLQVRLIDADEQGYVYDNFAASPSKLLFEDKFDFGTRHYRLQTMPTATYFKQHRSWQSWGVLAMGTFGTSLLGALLLLGTGYTARVVRQVDEKTRELKESESRLNELFENLRSGVAIYRPSPDGREFIISAFNQAAERIDNVHREDLIGKNVEEAFPGVREFGLLDVLNRVRESGVAEHFPVSFYQDGRISGWRENYVTRLPNGEVVAIFEDVTEAKQAEQALKQSKDQLAAILNSTTESIFQVDVNGIILATNEVGAHRFDKEPQDMVGKCSFDFFPPEVAASRRNTLAEVFRTGKGKYTEDTRNDRHFSMNYYPISGKDGKTESVVVYAADITERRNNQMRMERLLVEQKALLENDLIGIVTVKDRTIRWANPAFEKMLGYGPGELAGVSTRQNYPSEEEYLAFGLAAYPVLFSGKIYRSQVRHVRKDGHPIWVDVSGSMLDRETGESLWGFIDITDRKNAEERLSLSLRGADLAMTDWHIPSDTLIFGEGWMSLLGYQTDELRSQSSRLAELIRPEDVPLARDALVRHLKGETPYFETEVRMRHKDGHWAWVLARGMAVERTAEGRAIRVAGTAMDISKRKKAESEIARLSQWNELLLNSAGEGIYGVDLEGRCTFINPAALGILGFAKEEVVGRNQHVVFHYHYRDGSSYPQEECPIYQTLRDGIRREVEDAFIRKNGEIFPVQMTVTPMHDDGQLVGAEVIFQDIAKRKEMEQELMRLATTDALTGVANRRHFIEQVETQLAHFRRFGQPATFLMVDIDHFKNVNDSFGHATGDAVLKHFAELSKLRLRRVDTLGRLGGEEFGILLPGTDSAGALHFAERFRQFVADTPAQSGKGTIAFTISIGIAELDSNDVIPDSLLARADEALYRAKESGRNRVEVG